MAIHDAFDSGNEGKSNFEDIYRGADPRPYFHALGELDYMIPGNAKPVFESVIEAYREEREAGPVTVVDLGCSYGVNAALLKYGLSMEDLYAHYTAEEVAGMTREELLRLDREFLKGRPEAEDLAFVGVDASPEAIAYATRAGLLDEGVAANLEEAPPPPPAAGKLAPADVVISTGCVGYVTERTFSQVIAAAEGEEPPWVASFVLRMFPYAAIEEALAEEGLRTEKLAGHAFVQRRFESEEERRHVLGQLEALDIDPAGMESEGRYVAEFFLSRTPEEVERRPLVELVAARLGAPEADLPPSGAGAPSGGMGPR